MPDETIKTPVYYIAGPMRGHPQFNFPAFDEAESTLKRDYNIDAINPARMDREIGFDPEKDTPDAAFLRQAFERDVLGILNADAVLALPGWENSRGAVAEVMICDWLGKPVYTYRPHEHPLDRVMRLAEPLKHLRHQLPPPITDPLEEALRITKGDRQEAYGDAKEDLGRVARLWEIVLENSLYLDDDGKPRITIHPRLVALCMNQIKVSREVYHSKEDNWVDIAGWARCGWQCTQ